jgi:SdpC family antimicrobial peptide
MRYRVRALVTVVSAAALLLAGATPSGATTLTVTGDNGALGSAAAQPAAASYDGRTIFVGIMFGYGPFADEYPELVGGKIEGAAPAQLAEFSAVVIEAVERVDPTFFDTFELAITSGDRVQVDQALRSASAVLHTALTDELGGSAPGDARTDLTTLISVAVTLIAAVHVAFAAISIIAVTANVAWDPLGSATGSMAQIDHERFVGQVADTLAS